MTKLVDIGEATIAKLGILDVLDGKADASAASRKTVAKYADEIEELARQFIADEKIKDRLTLFDQKKVARIVTANPESALAALISIPWVDPVPAIGQTLRLRNMLGQLRPTSRLTKLFEVRELPVSSFTWHEFEHALRLIDNPLSIFGCMQSGRVNRKLVNVLSQAYPSTFETIAARTCVRAVTAIAAGHQISSRVEDSLSVLLSVDGIGSKVAAAIGAPRQPGTKGKPPSNVQHGSGLSLAPKSAALDGQ